jgi:hypothetical protein
LYGGGMGGLQDAGSSAMASAITRLSEALRQATKPDIHVRLSTG